MNLFADSQRKLTFGVLTSYTEQVSSCASDAHLTEIAKACILEVVATALPDLKVVFQPKDLAP
jgi:hypothetical protein